MRLDSSMVIENLKPNKYILQTLMQKKAAFLIIIIFLILALPNIYYPGVSIDEADEANACDFMFKNDSLARQKILAGYHVDVFNKILPIMQGPYTGRIHAYLTCIFSRLFGSNVFTLRFTPIITSAITICFIYLLCKIWFGFRAASITSLLVATNLYFVQYSRVGQYREEVFIICFFWAGLFFLSKYLQLRERKPNLLYLSLFLFGLGLSTKLAMILYLVGLVIVFILLRKEFNPLLGLRVKHIGLALASFSLGAFNVILFNVFQKGESFKYLFNCLTNPSFAGYNNLAYFSNLSQRVCHFVDLLKSNLSERMNWGVIQSCPVEIMAPIFAWFFFIIFLFILLGMIFSKNMFLNIRNKVLFIFILYSIVFLLTPFTPHVSHPGNLLLLLPFPQIVIALFLDYIWCRCNKKIIFLIAAHSTVLIPVLIFNVWMNIYFYHEMKENGGFGRWSTAIYELADYLNDERIYTPVTFGFGLQHNIAFLTNYQVIPLRIDNSYTSDSVVEEYKQLFSEAEPVFYLTRMSEEYKPNLDLFMQLAKRDGRNKELYKLFYNRARFPVYWLYKIY